MKQLCIATLGIVFALWFAAFPAIAAEDKTPAQAYLEYQDAVSKATALSEILPYVSVAYRAMLESRPKEDHPVWIENLKEGVMTDIKVITETIAGNTCTLEATGTSKRGNTMKGKIILLKEGTSWQVDEEFWTMLLPEGLR
jgi:hypothetical protein